MARTVRFIIGQGSTLRGALSVPIVDKLIHVCYMTYYPGAHRRCTDPEASNEQANSLSLRELNGLLLHLRDKDPNA